jgi:RPA family protein
MTPRDRWILEQAIRTLCRIEAARKPKRLYRKPKKVKALTRERAS